MHKAARLAAAATFMAAFAFQPAAADDPHCEKEVAVRGFPHRTKAMADLSALRQWSQAVQKRHGYAFAMWHNAGAAALRCGPVEEGARHHVCIAIGRPCRASVRVPADVDGFTVPRAR